MRKKGYHVAKRAVHHAAGEKSAEQIIREARQTAKSDYRTQSLLIHGPICAKCGREFDAKDSHLLTVHHKDGNSANNPPDGSNWENLCVYCHDDEHSRGVLGDYFSQANKDKRPK